MTDHTCWHDRGPTALYVKGRKMTLPIPEVNDVELAFPTAKYAPAWEDVPDAFKDEPGGDYNSRDNPWCACAQAFYSKDLQDWQALPQEGVDPEKAFRAIRETLGSFGISHQHKIGTLGYMLSEWFQDFWWKGDENLRVSGVALKDAFEEPGPPE
tara:strand:- start:423 stop:887 length:465 start_codon:yes stop_codon:yes gene_type:complete